MAKYMVELVSTRQYTALIEVEADDMLEAETKAVEEAQEAELDWQYYDGEGIEALSAREVGQDGR